ncbi:DUF3788 domain-containing protein [Anoxybacterium hadale]|uniref:DUF3788 domain-containing protein n=1 Tax=Anoxybacterium hadale TaxID=3408580 RepID=A0ACD1AB50_9FIRM|nr:DUF3788 domain-containing protein [Clostridiales bacterium]
MEWSRLFDSSREPETQEIQSFIGGGEPLYTQLRSYLEDVYNAKAKAAYSSCSAQPGWNVKYQKSGKSLCTIYPMEGFFIVLVVIGAKETAETEAGVAIGAFTPYIRELYENTPFSCGGRWLMIRVTSEEILADVKKLIALRVKPNNKS